MGDAGFAAARRAGRFVGSALDCGAWMCPIPPGRHQRQRDAWMLGFSEGRIARLRLSNTHWPEIEISLAAFKRAVEQVYGNNYSGEPFRRI
ncbi:hypothetical protein [Aureimonas leprariae]|uniref:hypothetical protein n=1 Tax=Plantimonas leprariae TaxID=2615207 RepID=UPI001386A676|nr:hypothetical protein [Aureimonas leprariae]